MVDPDQPWRLNADPALQLGGKTVERNLPKGQPIDELMPLVYDELRRLAAAYMRRERPGQTIQATALVNEVYLRLAGAGTPWHDKRHFVGIAARAMRQILIERARARGAQKRWAALDRVSLTESLVHAMLLGAALVADATLVAPGGPVAAVLTMSLGLGIALAVLVLETATTRAAFGEG
jgi:RNA polymerase sigma factor (TIGR02999 family)